MILHKLKELCFDISYYLKMNDDERNLNSEDECR